MDASPGPWLVWVRSRQSRMNVWPCRLDGRREFGCRIDAALRTSRVVGVRRRKEKGEAGREKRPKANRQQQRQQQQVSSVPLSTCLWKGGRRRAAELGAACEFAIDELAQTKTRTRTRTRTTTTITTTSGWPRKAISAQKHWPTLMGARCRRASDWWPALAARLGLARWRSRRADFPTLHR